MRVYSDGTTMPRQCMSATTSRACRSARMRSPLPVSPARMSPPRLPYPAWSPLLDGGVPDTAGGLAVDPLELALGLHRRPEGPPEGGRSQGPGGGRRPVASAHHGPD